MDEWEERQAARLNRIEMVLGTLIYWVAQSANAPISPAEATRLLAGLQRETENDIPR